MKKYLFIAEKPSLMREVQAMYKKHQPEITNKVGEIDFIALAGHVCGLCLPNDYPQWNAKWRELTLPMIPESFKVKAMKDKADIIKKVKAAVSSGKYDAVIVGTDADVEGNLIYDFLEQHLHLRLPAYRYFENDLTDKELFNSMMHLTDFHSNPRDVHMTEAGRIRSREDWLIGMNCSVACTNKSGFLMRVGRVKVPTLMMVYDNCMAIDSFTSKTDYELQAVYQEGFEGFLLDSPVFSEVKGKESNASRRFQTEAEALKYGSGLLRTGVVRDMEKKVTKTKAPQLYKLSDIQVDAGKVYKYSAEKTLQLVQSLYETHKLVSYPRTDGRCISTEKSKEFPTMLKAVAALPGLKSFVDRITSADMERVRNDKKIVNNDEVKKASHDALLPTGKIPDVSRLSKDELNVLSLIYKRLLAVFLPPLQEEKTAITVSIDSDLFRTTGKVLIDDGWTKIYDRKSSDKPLPNINTGDTIHVREFNAVEKTTTPPKRLTQATLIGQMENFAKYIEDKKLKTMMQDVKGIGMPSSRAKIISDLIKTGYMDDQKDGLHITDTGKQYIENLKGLKIARPEITAEWETRMQHIKEGSEDYTSVEKDMIRFVREVVAEIQASDIQRIGSDRSGTSYKCPVCGKPLIKGKFGYFCSGKKDSGCPCSIPDEIAGKRLTESQKKSLIEKGKTGIIKGFNSKAGKEFSAALALSDGKVRFVFN